MKSHYSDEIINAFVDGELDGPEKEKFKLEMDVDDELFQRVKSVCELKKSLKQSYEQVTMPKDQFDFGHKSTFSVIRYGMAALLMLGLGVMLGWYSNEQVSIKGVAQSEALHGFKLTPVSMSQPNKILLHIASSKKEKLQQTLHHIQNIIDKYDVSDLPFQIEVIANAGGIDLLREDVTPYKQKISEITAEYENVSFIACSSALDRLKVQGIEPRLISQAKTGVTAVEQIVKRLQEGWVYVKV